MRLKSECALGKAPLGKVLLWTLWGGPAVFTSDLVILGDVIFKMSRHMVCSSGREACSSRRARAPRSRCQPPSQVAQGQSSEPELRYVYGGRRSWGPSVYGGRPSSTHSRLQNRSYLGGTFIHRSSWGGPRKDIFVVASCVASLSARSRPKQTRCDPHGRTDGCTTFGVRAWPRNVAALLPQTHKDPCPVFFNGIYDQMIAF